MAYLFLLLTCFLAMAAGTDSNFSVDSQSSDESSGNQEEAQGKTVVIDANKLDASTAGQMGDGHQVHFSMFISNKYASGEYLIYDCRDRHFACVDKVSFEDCQDVRKESFEDREAVLACAPLKKYSFYLECTVNQIHYLESRPNKSFCRNFKLSSQ